MSSLIVARRGVSGTAGASSRSTSPGSRVDAGRGDLLDVRSVATDADDHPVAELDRRDLAGVDLAEVVDELLEPLGRARLVAEVEPLEPGDPLLVAVGDPVEVLLHRGGEVVVDQPREVLLEQPRHGERQPGRYQGVAAGAHVATVLDRAHDRRIRRRAPDPLLLHGFHEGGLGVARRRLGLVTVGLGPDHRERGAFAELRQTALLLGDLLALLGDGLVAALLVGGEEPPEGDDGAAGGELRGPRDLDAVQRRRRASRSRSSRGRRPSGRRRSASRSARRARTRHRAAHRPPAPGVRNRSPAGRIASWASCAFLTLPAYRRWLGGHVVGAVEVARLAPRGGDRALRQRDRVGTHIGDVAVLVEPLRDAHGVLRGQPQLARRLLLEGRRRERRRRTTRVGLLLDAGDDDRRLLRRRPRWPAPSPRRGGRPTCASARRCRRSRGRWRRGRRLRH